MGKQTTLYSRSGSGVRCQFSEVLRLPREAVRVLGNTSRHRRPLRLLRWGYARYTRTWAPSICVAGESAFLRPFRSLRRRSTSVYRSGSRRGILKRLNSSASAFLYFEFRFSESEMNIPKNSTLSGYLCTIPFTGESRLSCSESSCNRG